MSANLTGKQQAFINAYLSTARFNATEAARLAGYEGTDESLAQIGYENLRKLEIATVIRERLNESAMSANEVLDRLSQIARGEVTDFLDEDGKFDLKTARKLRKQGLLKKIKSKRTSKQVDCITDNDQRETLETALIQEEVEFELYSAHDALRDLGKFHKLFTEKHEHSGKDDGPIKLNVAYDG